MRKIEKALSSLPFILKKELDKIKYYSLFHSPSLRVEAYSILETTLAVLNEFREIDGELYSPMQGWGDPLAYAQIEKEAGLEIAVKIEDEGGKIALSRVSPDLLNILFEEIGISLSEAGGLADSLLDWVDADDLTHIDGAESDHYERNDPPYQAANGPIQSWEEFRLIKGFDTLFFDEETGLPNTQFDQFKEAISLHHDSPVNLNSAGPLVLAVLSRVEGYDAEALQQYFSGSDGERGTDDDRFLDTSSTFGVGESEVAALQTQVLKVEVSVKRGESIFLLSTIVSWGGDSGEPGDSEERSLRDAFEEDEEDTEDRTETISAGGQIEDVDYPFQIIRLVENFKI